MQIRIREAALLITDRGDGILLQFAYRRCMYHGKDTKLKISGPPRVSLVTQRVPPGFRPLSRRVALRAAAEQLLRLQFSSARAKT